MITRRAPSGRETGKYGLVGTRDDVSTSRHRGSDTGRDRNPKRFHAGLAASERAHKGWTVSFRRAKHRYRLSLPCGTFAEDGSIQMLLGRDIMCSHEENAALISF